ncbi:MAG TPA: ABC transporter permease [Thermomicrobiales bacterium]|nr:ABC transporter permease [Thermomicrobiales bacterium]
MSLQTNATVESAGIPPSSLGQQQRGRSSDARLYLRALLHDKVTLAAVIFLLVLLFCALFAPLVAPFDPEAQSLMLRNQPPMTEDPNGGSLPHLLGTDQLGRDLLSRLFYGARISLAVGIAGAAFSGTVGVVLGLIAGYYRGVVDDIIMRLVDTQMGFPSLMTALLVLYVLGPGMWKVILVLAVTRWMVFARVTRSLVLSTREEVFVEAARTVGCTDRRILFRHILPNLLSPLLVLVTLEVATMILTEASLSFLGLGIQPPQSSWGLMLAQGRAYVTSAWWLVTFPGLIILFTALSLNLVATWARAVSDPVTRWRYLGGSKVAAR